jgi:alkaline phosphatase D
MTLHIDRRLLLRAATLGLGALAVPGAAQILAVRGFTHAVASGEPGHYKVMLWSRYVPAAGDAARLVWQVSAEPDFATVASSGDIVADPSRDWCVKPVAEGLAAGKWYYYRFLDAAGRPSPVGRTRTLPNGRVDRFGLGVFSCSNLPFGHFNAYGHAAARSDIDLMVHLGDYIYEYGHGTYPPLAHAVAGRLPEPAHEAVALADYRLRYAAYRADPDLQRLHQLFPMVAMWDDHESANDSWQDGAENHDPATEGDWEVRKAAAMRAYREWLPVSDEPWRAYRIGDLATLFRPETRLAARSRQLDLGSVLRGREDIGRALVEFRDGAWQDPGRTMLGAEQEAWLAEGLRHSVGDGVRWQLLAQQVIMGTMTMAPEAAAWVTPDAAAEVRQLLPAALAAAQVGLPYNLDMWDGYPAARARLLRSALDANSNLIVLSGDSHNAWAFDLDLEGAPVGAEFAGHSVTSPGLEAYLRVAPADVARAAVGHNPQLRWADTSRRGYLSLTLTRERATGEWHFLDSVRARAMTMSGSHRMGVVWGARRFA